MFCSVPQLCLSCLTPSPFFFFFGTALPAAIQRSFFASSLHLFVFVSWATLIRSYDLVPDVSFIAVCVQFFNSDVYLYMNRTFFYLIWAYNCHINPFLDEYCTIKVLLERFKHCPHTIYLWCEVNTTLTRGSMVSALSISNTECLISYLKCIFITSCTERAKPIFSYKFRVNQSISRCIHFELVVLFESPVAEWWHICSTETWHLVGKQDAQKTKSNNCQFGLH